MEGRGKLTTTGKLGDVMQESAQAAMSYVRSRAQYLGCRRISIGISIFTCTCPKARSRKTVLRPVLPLRPVSVARLRAIPVRCDIAMTGEITVRGRVLPIGGLKEKLLAAHRQGILEVVLPRDNEKDLVDIPENIRKEMKLHFVFSMDEVLKIALEREIVALPLAPPTTARDLAAAA